MEMSKVGSWGQMIEFGMCSMPMIVANVMCRRLGSEIFHGAPGILCIHAFIHTAYTMTKDERRRGRAFAGLTAGGARSMRLRNAYEACFSRLSETRLGADVRHTKDRGIANSSWGARACSVAEWRIQPAAGFATRAAVPGLGWWPAWAVGESLGARPREKKRIVGPAGVEVGVGGNQDLRR